MAFIATKERIPPAYPSLQNAPQHRHLQHCTLHHSSTEANQTCSCPRLPDTHIKNWTPPAILLPPHCENLEYSPTRCNNFSISRSLLAQTDVEPESVKNSLLVFTCTWFLNFQLFESTIHYKHRTHYTFACKNLQYWRTQDYPEEEEEEEEIEYISFVFLTNFLPFVLNVFMLSVLSCG